MAYKIIETELALQDLDSILAYLALTLANSSAASSFADEVEECYSNLERMPQMFEFCHNPRFRALGYHKVVIKNYIMIYKVDETNKNVYVMRFFYGRQDYEKLL